MAACPASRLYLLEGEPGSGKTTLGLQFLLEGARRGEKVLYVTLSETREEIETVAASHGWSLDALELFELATAAEVLGEAREQSILHPWEMELGATVRLIQEKVAASGPPASCSTACRKCGSWRRTPCAIAGRCWR